MKRWTAVILVVAFVAFVITACAPGLVPGTKGIPAGRAPFYGSISIQVQPLTFDTNPNGGAVFWNEAAGRRLFTVTNVNPVIKFQADKGPLCGVDMGQPAVPPCGPNTRRVVAYSQIIYGANAAVYSCIIHYDPAWVAVNEYSRHLSSRVWAHEIGHCLSLKGDQNDCVHRSVMSACDFWGAAIRGDAPNVHDTNQLRAAGYIR